MGLCEFDLRFSSVSHHPFIELNQHIYFICLWFVCFNMYFPFALRVLFVACFVHAINNEK